MKWEEYVEEYYRSPLDLSEWCKTNLECPECEGPIYKNIRYVLISDPPKYRYKCPKCGWEKIWY